MVSGTSTCSLTCPDSQFIDVKVPNYCQLCSSPCLTCAGSSTTCKSCQTGNYFLNGACYSSCPSGTYSDYNTSLCLGCDSVCLTCTGSGVNSCLSCKSPYFLYFLDKSTNSCVTVCPNGGSGNKTDNICYQCLYFTYNSQCVQSCPSGYVGVIAAASTCV